jgi:hypothetical protein
MRTIVCASDPEDKKLAAFATRSLSKEAEIVGDQAFSRSVKKKASGAFVYFDARLGADRVFELASKLDGLDASGWGVLDREGKSEDPAAFFFAGASDYIGPALFKAGLGPGRLGEALAYAGLVDADAPVEGADGAEGPAGCPAFPGWASLEEGVDVAVRFCYAAIGDQRGLLERIGDKRLDKLKEDFAAFLESWSKECGGLVWIKEGSGCLLLFPPQDEGMNPVLASFRLLLDRALIGYEVFKLEAPLSFRFAFHAGRTMWRKPGETGRVVSEDVNFVFHLGMKAAGDGYILLSAEAGGSVPACLRDLFSPAGDFEGRSLLASRKFKD